MGMFDTLSVAKSSFKELRNTSSFQTKSLDCTLAHYVIFNDQLWMESDGNESFDLSKPVDLTCDINVYGTPTENGITRWIEFNLHIECGKLTAVDLARNEITKDSRDLSAWRPTSKTAQVTINLAGSDESYEHFHSNLDENLEKIRTIIGCHKATIIYPQKYESNASFGMGAGCRMIASVVQDLSDFQKIFESDNCIAIKNTDQQGSNIKIFLDEASYLFNR